MESKSLVTEQRPQFNHALTCIRELVRWLFGYLWFYFRCSEWKRSHAINHLYNLIKLSQ